MRLWLWWLSVVMAAVHEVVAVSVTGHVAVAAVAMAMQLSVGITMWWLWCGHGT